MSRELERIINKLVLNLVSSRIILVSFSNVFSLLFILPMAPNFQFEAVFKQIQIRQITDKVITQLGLFKNH